MSGIRVILVAVGLLALFVPHARAQVIAYQPVINSIPDGAILNVTPVVTADRRYVRLTVSPFFSTFDGFQNFVIPGAVTGGNGLGGGLGGLGGGLGGGGLGGGGGVGGGGGGFRNVMNNGAPMGAFENQVASAVMGQMTGYEAPYDPSYLAAGTKNPYRKPTGNLSKKSRAKKAPAKRPATAKAAAPPIASNSRSKTTGKPATSSSSGR
jgi:hypothetical protein